MKLTDMFRRVLVESGQFIIPDEEIELDITKFKILIQSTLGVHNTYCPIPKRVTLSTGSSREYIFTDQFSFEGEVLGIPEWISDVTPIRIVGVPNYFFQNLDSPKYALEKTPFTFQYTKPKLYLQTSSRIDATLVYLHKLIPIDENGGTVVDPTVTEIEDWELPNIDDNDTEFFKLLTGKFLKAVGGSRTAFTLSALELQDDGADLKADGKELEEQANEDYIERHHDFYLGW